MLIAQAEAYLEDLRAATAAAHDRLRAGTMRLHPQPHVDEPVPEPERFVEDPIFMTREFDVPPQAIWKD